VVGITKKKRGEMTKKELGKLRYDRHYANVKARLISKYRTRPSDIHPYHIPKGLFITSMENIQEALDEYYATYGRMMTDFYTQIRPNTER